MARRPANVDREAWLEEREAIWRWRNRWLSLLMLGAIAALAWRYLL